jgi:hypothetical protein
MFSNPVSSSHDGNTLFRVANDFFDIAFRNEKQFVVHYPIPMSTDVQTTALQEKRGGNSRGYADMNSCTINVSASEGTDRVAFVSVLSLGTCVRLRIYFCYEHTLCHFQGLLRNTVSRDAIYKLCHDDRFSFSHSQGLNVTAASRLEGREPRGRLGS